MEELNKESLENVPQPNNVVHGVRLKEMLVFLEKELGWEEMGNRIKINCFISNPSMGSSITFLRRTSWAKEQVQELFIDVKMNGKDSTKFKTDLEKKAKKKVAQKSTINRKPIQQTKSERINRAEQTQPRKSTNHPILKIEKGTKDLSDFIDKFNKKK
jgi:uncharacterized protein (DUF2132 family)